MPKANKKPAKTIDKTKIILLGIIGILIVICVILNLAFYNEKNKSAVNTDLDRDFSSTYVNLGAMQYNFDTVNHKVTKRTDTTIQELHTFLTNESNNSRCGGSGSNGPGYEYVAANSADDTQVLLKYGCFYPGPSIYAVKTDQGWKTISPTNHFDLFDIPDCDYLTENNISPEIAPVCANKLGENGQPTGNPKYLNR